MSDTKNPVENLNQPNPIPKKSDTNNNTILITKEINENEEDDYLRQVDVNTDQETATNKRLSTLSTSSDSFSSSLNNSSTFNRLKGILKKPRSCSESESTAGFYNNGDSLTNSFKNCFIGSSSSSGGGCDGGSGESGSGGIGSDLDNANLSSSKKSVSFNKQVVRNVFKPGSTVIGMKKPGSGKNKKKNKRNRTVSDPSHDSNADAVSLKDAGANNGFRNRSVSESSDDSSCLMTNSNESLQDSVQNKPVQVESQNQQQTSKNKKKKKKKAAKANNEPVAPAVMAEQAGEKKTFDMETMLEWKNQGILPSGDVKHTTKSAIKLKNSIINDLDD